MKDSFGNLIPDIPYLDLENWGQKEVNDYLRLLELHKRVQKALDQGKTVRYIKNTVVIEDDVPETIFI